MKRERERRRLSIHSSAVWIIICLIIVTIFLLRLLFLGLFFTFPSLSLLFIHSIFLSLFLVYILIRFMILIITFSSFCFFMFWYFWYFLQSFHISYFFNLLQLLCVTFWRVHHLFLFFFFSSSFSWIFSELSIETGLGFKIAKEKEWRKGKSRRKKNDEKEWKGKWSCQSGTSDQSIKTQLFFPSSSFSFDLSTFLFSLLFHLSFSPSLLTLYFSPFLLSLHSTQTVCFPLISIIH